MSGNHFGTLITGLRLLFGVYIRVFDPENCSVLKLDFGCRHLFFRVYNPVSTPKTPVSFSQRKTSVESIELSIILCALSKLLLYMKSNRNSFEHYIAILPLTGYAMLFFNYRLNFGNPFMQEINYRLRSIKIQW